MKININNLKGKKKLLDGIWVEIVFCIWTLTQYVFDIYFHERKSGSTNEY
jgi:hypothetical protein